MAAIIAILLVLGIGNWIVKGNEKIKQKQRAAKFQDNNEAKLFFCNLYAVTWQYYQQLEPEVIRTLAEYVPQSATYFTLQDLERYSRTIYGESIWERSIEKAFLEMKKHGCPVFRRNHDPETMHKFGCEFLLLGKGESYEIREDLDDYKMEMKHPGAFYDWGAAKSVSYLFPLKCIPEEDDPRTYCYYTYGSDGKGEPRFHFRQNTPNEIAEAVNHMMYPNI